MVPILLIGLPIHRPRDDCSAALGEAFGRPQLQPLMHNEELAIFIEIRLRSCGNGVPIETGNNFRDLFDAEGDEAIAQIA